MISSAQLIYDTSGDIVTSSNAYYLMPVSRGSGGGFNIAAVQDYHTRCPYYSVVQSPHDRCGSYFGLPVKFSRSSTSTTADSNHQEVNVTLSTDFTINFSTYTPHAPRYCDQPTTMWNMVSRGGSGDDMSVELGMVHFGGLNHDDDDDDNDDDDDRQSSLFKIVKNKAYGYRLRFCPSNSNSSALKDVVCGDLAPVYDRRLGVRVLRLVDSKSPAMIMFHKA
ncbi:hypothetical protein BVRB_6g154170 [Beta vulgaris subsp. vulgaris]|nr:hypothetical protein BVRB_6g154170 [Beta vulgaris subsp. vulgaris]